MKIPAPLKDQGISQDMVTTLRAITAFRRSENPRRSSSQVSGNIDPRSERPEKPGKS